MLLTEPTHAVIKHETWTTKLLCTCLRALDPKCTQLDKNKRMIKDCSLLAFEIKGQDNASLKGETSSKLQGDTQLRNERRLPFLYHMKESHLSQTALLSQCIRPNTRKLYFQSEKTDRDISVTRGETKNIHINLLEMTLCFLLSQSRVSWDHVCSNNSIPVPTQPQFKKLFFLSALVELVLLIVELVTPKGNRYIARVLCLSFFPCCPQTMGRIRDNSRVTTLQPFRFHRKTFKTK